MTMYEKMVALNNENKSNIRNKQSFAENPKKHKVRVEVLPNRVYFIRESDRSMTRIYSILDVYKFLSLFSDCYITNISLLKVKTDIFNKYLLSEDEWFGITEFVFRSENIVNSFRIFRVTNLEQYLSRLLLTKTITILYRAKKDFFVVIKTGTNDIFVVSELILCVNKKTSFTFKELGNVKSFYISNLNIADKNVGVESDLVSLFEWCDKTEEIYFENFNTCYISDFSYMFKNCTQLKKVNLEVLDLSKARYLSYMFDSCSNLKVIDISNLAFPDKIANMEGMFDSCENLEQIKGITKIEMVKNKKERCKSIFESCNKLNGLVYDKIKKEIQI